jgi:hypothetical protein
MAGAVVFKLSTIPRPPSPAPSPSPFPPAPQPTPPAPTPPRVYTVYELFALARADHRRRRAAEVEAARKRDHRD